MEIAAPSDYKGIHSDRLLCHCSICLTKLAIPIHSEIYVRDENALFNKLRVPRAIDLTIMMKSCLLL